MAEADGLFQSGLHAPEWHTSFSMVSESGHSTLHNLKLCSYPMYWHELLCRFHPLVTDNGGVLRCGALAVILKKKKKNAFV